jgi:hypothetical protein
LSTQTGTVVLNLTTSDGLFLFFPSWAEKVMGWYYPMDPSTSTFGTPQRLDYNIDIDEYYESYRVISALFTVVGNTTSTTMAALSGSFNGAIAYNSLANLLGNNTTTYQIYSYANILGLTSDPLAKEGAIPAYEGIGALFVNNPRRPWARLEDSVPYSPSNDVDPDASWFKFVDTADSYNLHGVTTVNPFGVILTTALPTRLFDSGTILLDFMRASSINWGVTSSITTNAATPFGLKLYYEMYDIAGSIVSQGTLHEERVAPPGGASAFQFSRSGAFPTLFNTSEATMNPPARSMKVYGMLYRIGADVTVTFTTAVKINLEVPVYNGLRDGVIQQPILIAHSGNEPDTKLSISARLNVEARMNSQVNKFTQVLYRNVSNRAERAILKIASNPGKYGLRWVFRLNKLDNIITGWQTAVDCALLKHSDLKINMALKELERCVPDLSHSDPAVRAEAASKATLFMRKLGKGLKGVSREAAEKIVKPIISEAGKAGNAALKQSLSQLLLELPLAVAADSYFPPRVSYSNNLTTGRAATGFARAYQAATRLPKKLEVEFETKDLSPESWVVPKKDISLFPVLFVDSDGGLTESEETVVGLFAIVPLTLLSGVSSVRTRIRSNYIENYVQTFECPTPTPIDPRENVALMRVDGNEGNCLRVARPSFPVTGRSLDLALWAFNQRLGAGFCVHWSS